MRYRGDAFRRLENGRWFPDRGIFKMPTDPEPGDEWVMKEVEVNR